MKQSSAILIQHIARHIVSHKAENTDLSRTEATFLATLAYDINNYLVKMKEWM